MSSNKKLSQLPRLPLIPDVEDGEVIGRGGFGIVKSARFQEKRIIAVKYIFLEEASKKGLSERDLKKEAAIQKACKSPNVIEVYGFGFDANWAWMAMELASQGELFDKIEPDLGVEESIAHFYFVQLLSAISFIHSMGVAHRDIKPENLVLDKHCNLKLTDFGLAAVYKKKSGPSRKCTQPCGSPPYVAPELTMKAYDPDIADIWSCGIVLYVLLTGQIAWEMPHTEDPDYKYFVEQKGSLFKSPWNKLSFETVSVLRDILKPDPIERITMKDLLKRKWVASKNEFMDPDSKMCKDPLRLTRKIMFNLHVNLSDEEFNKVNDAATQIVRDKVIETQPIFLDDDDDAEDSIIYKENYVPTRGYSASQVDYTELTKRRKTRRIKELTNDEDKVFQLISQDPAALQFIPANKAKDKDNRITSNMAKFQNHQYIFSETLNRFFSTKPLDDILFLLLESLIKLDLRKGQVANTDYLEQLKNNDKQNKLITIPINGRDSSKSPIIGTVRVTKMADNLSIGHRIEFVKGKADPLEFRRVFKRVTILCRDIVYVPPSQ